MLFSSEFTVRCCKYWSNNACNTDLCAVQLLFQRICLSPESVQLLLQKLQKSLYRVPDYKRLPSEIEYA